MRVFSPSTLTEALDMLAAQPLTPIAGGTDLLVSWPHRIKDDLALLDLSRLNELAGIRPDDNNLVLGALTTYWQILVDRRICAEFPLLQNAARQVGAIQIQTRGTWAGNIANASPAADGVPVLMAYDAVVVLQNRTGTREVPLDAFYSGYKKMDKRPDELIVAIRIPRRVYDLQWFHKVGARSAQAITKVGVAVTRGDAGWRVVANSVAPVVCRCRHLEAALERGDALSSPSAVQKVLARDISPITDIRSSAEYRSRVLSRLLFHGLNASA